MKWRTLSAVFTQSGFALLGYFQGRRDVRTPMWAAIITNVVNVVLDVWLIFGWGGVAFGGRRWLAMAPHGIQGAALATSIGVALNTLLLAGAALRDPVQRLRYRIHVPRRLRLRSLVDLVRVGLPSSLEGFLDMSSFSLFTVLIGRGGAMQLAASQITVQLLSFSFMPMWGLTSTGGVLTGNWVGAARPATAARYGRQVYKLGFAYCLFLAVVFASLRGVIFRVFTPDPAVLAFGASLALTAAVFQIGDGLRMIGSGLLTGAGDTRTVMLVTLGVMWGIFIPLTWYLVVVRGGDVRLAWMGGALCYALQADPALGPLPLRPVAKRQDLQGRDHSHHLTAAGTSRDSSGARGGKRDILSPGDASRRLLRRPALFRAAPPSMAPRPSRRPLERGVPLPSAWAMWSAARSRRGYR